MEWYQEHTSGSADRKFNPSDGINLSRLYTHYFLPDVGLSHLLFDTVLYTTSKQQHCYSYEQYFCGWALSWGTLNDIERMIYTIQHSLFIMLLVSQNEIVQDFSCQLLYLLEKTSNEWKKRKKQYIYNLGLNINDWIPIQCIIIMSQNHKIDLAVKMLERGNKDLIVTGDVIVTGQPLLLITITHILASGEGCWRADSWGVSDQEAHNPAAAHLPHPAASALPTTFSPPAKHTLNSYQS